MAAGKQHKPLTARGRFWQKHLERWRQSGLSQAQYGYIDTQLEAGKSVEGIVKEWNMKNPEKPM